MIYQILFSKVFIFSIWSQQTFACSESIIRRKFEICSQLTIKTLGQRRWHRSSVFILNLEQFSHLILPFQLLNLNRSFLVGTDDITSKASQKNIFFHLILQLLKFVLWYIYQRMEQEWAAYSFNYPLVLLHIVCKIVMYGLLYMLTYSL